MVSYTRPISQIFQYRTWLLGSDGNDASWSGAELSAFKKNARGLIVKFAGYDSREATGKFIGCDIGIEKSRLEKLAAGEYYWLELIGLEVINLEGVVLGKVDHLLETGANDVLVIRCGAAEDGQIERLLPWIPDVIADVDLENQVMTVDWKEDYLI